MSSFLRFLVPANKFTVSGLVLLVLGFLLLPLLVGLPLVIIGSALLVFGIIGYFLNFLPGGRIIKDYFRSVVGNSKDRSI